MNFSSVCFQLFNLIMACLLVVATPELVVVAAGAGQGHVFSDMLAHFRASSLLQSVAFGYCLLLAWLIAQEIPPLFERSRVYSPSLGTSVFWMEADRLCSVCLRTGFTGALALIARAALPGTLFSLPKAPLYIGMAVFAYALFAAMVGVAGYVLVRQLRTHSRRRQYDRQSAIEA